MRTCIGQQQRTIDGKTSNKPTFFDMAKPTLPNQSSIQKWLPVGFEARASMRIQPMDADLTIADGVAWFPSSQIGNIGMYLQADAAFRGDAFG